MVPEQSKNSNTIYKKEIVKLKEKLEYNNYTIKFVNDILQKFDSNNKEFFFNLNQTLKSS